MAWTAADEARLQQLQRRVSGAADEQHGAPTIKTLDNGAHKDGGGFTGSLYRVVVGGVRDAIQDAHDFSMSLGRAASSIAPGGIIGHPDLGDNFLTRPLVDTRTPIAQPTGTEHAGPIEAFARSAVSFALPFGVASKALGAARAASVLGRVGTEIAAGAVTSFTKKPTDVNPINEASAQWFHDHFGIDKGTLDSLASDPNDDSLGSRFKAAVVSLPLDLAFTGVVEGGIHALKAYRGWRGSQLDAQAAIEAINADMGIHPNREAVATNEAAQSVFNEARQATGAPEQGDLFAPAKAAAEGATEAPPTSLSDVAAFLERKATTGATDEEIAHLSDALNGNPSSAFKNALGIDPLKMDFSALDNAETFNSIKESLQNSYTAIANRLGRTGERVTASMTARAARALASSPETLKDLYLRTNNLDAVMHASQTIVGAHAQHLVGKAEAALAAAKSGVDNGEWDAFREAFHRQAYLLGALRGAGSEVGRALRSLQNVLKAKSSRAATKSAVKKVEKAAGSELKQQAEGGGGENLADSASAAVDRMGTDAERIAFLSQIKSRGGDLGDLNRFTRVQSQSTLRRLSSGFLNEARGNLFSSATGLTNVGSTYTMMGMRAASMALATLRPALLAPFSRDAARAARIQAMATWAFVDGGFGGRAWTEAFNNMFQALKQHGLEELALNANALGAKGLAAKAAINASEAANRVRSNFERVDVVTHERQFKMDAADLQDWHNTIDEWDAPKLMQHTAKWMANVLGATVNAIGTAQRVPTQLFINGADNFAGTMAARAGAQSAAIRIAGAEALENGLEGKELSQFMRARMHQLTDTTEGHFVFPDGSHDAYSMGLRDSVLAAGTVEAKTALFQDDLENPALRAMSHAITAIPGSSLFVPFVKTPLRILETTLGDYTLLGLAKNRLRDDIRAGGWKRDEALARIGLGTFMTYMAFQMAEDRSIVGFDGGYGSSARTSRPQYSLKIGDDVVEFKRFDPLGTILGLGADFHAYLKQSEDDNPDERMFQGQQIIAAVGVALAHNVLEKTWLTGLKNLVDLASSTTDGTLDTQFSRTVSSFAQRFVPAAGLQKSFVNSPVREAGEFTEGLLKVSVGADRLPVKRDVLGDPVKQLEGDVASGFKVGPDEATDPLHQELSRLSFQIGKPSRTFHGVKLTSTQLSRLMQLRGQVVTQDGLTMKKRLETLVGLPAYQALPDAGRVQAFRDSMRGYQHEADAQLIREDHSLARRVLRQELWNKSLLDGTRDTVDQRTREAFAQLGLTTDSSTIPDQTKP